MPFKLSIVNVGRPVKSRYPKLIPWDTLLKSTAEFPINNLTFSEPSGKINLIVYF